jgi:hypothetical protein
MKEILKFSLIQPCAYRGGKATTIFKFQFIFYFASPTDLEAKMKRAIQRGISEAEGYLQDNWIEGIYDLYVNGQFIPTMIKGVEIDSE